jgi:hypothetical protein
MSIPKPIAHKLIGMAQVILSNMEIGKLLDAKRGLLRMSAIIAVEGDRECEDTDVDFSTN